jgi:glycine C-acetyltransferase
MLPEDRLAADMAKELMGEGIYVIGFSFPVVPKGKARIRVQISAAHTKDDILKAVAAFTKAGKKFGALSG